VSALSQSVADYLAIRRAVGFKLDTADRWLADFPWYVESHGGAVTIAIGLEWAASTTKSKGGAARRLSTVRLFSRYLQAIDPGTEVLPPGLVPFVSRRRVPYLYSEGEVEAMMRAARELQPPLWAASTETAIGLLATTGMRVGEVIGLDDDDLDFEDSVLTVRLAKFHKSRLVPVTGEHARRHRRVPWGPARVVPGLADTRPACDRDRCLLLRQLT